jgi:hypothetical protein
MDDLKVYHWTGAFGLAGVVLFLCELPLWILPGPGPPINDAVAHSQYLADIRVIVLTRVLLDMGMYVCLMVFFAGFRHLIQRTRSEYEWVATLVFGAGLVWWAVSLVADSLEGAAALDSLGGTADPSAVRALVMGTLLIYNGSIAFAVTALFMASAGYAILATGALPKWTGWVACASTILCLVAIPSMYAGVVDTNGFYNVAGWGPTIVANVPPLIWFFITSISMIRMRETVAQK